MCVCESERVREGGGGGGGGGRTYIPTYVYIPTKNCTHVLTKQQTVNWFSTYM